MMERGMAIPKKVQEYLKKEKVGYQPIEHSKLFTAAEIAGDQHIPGKKMVKTVIVKADKDFIMCLVAATHHLDLNKFKKIVKAKEVRLATEEEMKTLFPECEVGSEPPFGKLYNLNVFADSTLEQDDEVAFNAGSHTDLIKMRFEEFQRVINPKFVEMGVHI